MLQDPEHFAEFRRIVDAIPFSHWEWQRAADASDASPVSRAVAFFVRARQSRAGKMEDFATLSRNRTRRGMNEQASAWLTVVEGLPAVHARLRGVVILTDDAFRVIRRQDDLKTFFYLDPPYLHETRASTGDYRYEMSDQDHRALLDTLAGIKGKFILSGYDNPMYADYMARHGWRMETFDLPNNAAAGKTKQRMIECVWMNY